MVQHLFTLIIYHLLRLSTKMSPTERTQHIDIQYFTIQDWHEEGTIIMQHIPGIMNPSDNSTKPLGYILHARHYCHIMGHYR